MASTGHTPPGSGASTQGGGAGVPAWTSPGNILADDTSQASVVVGSPAETDSERLYASQFGLSVGTTIQGIEVIVTHDSSGISTGFHRMCLTKGGTIATKSPTDFTPSKTGAEVVQTFGGPTEMWGTTWTEAEVEAATFGVFFWADAGGDGDADSSVDYITVNVYYEALVANEPSVLRVGSSGLRW